MNNKKIVSIRVLSMSLLCLLMTACPSVPMKQVKVVREAALDKVLVTFVRQSVFAGDGIAFDIWDGTHYVGSLRAGTIIQYRTTAGEHLFLAGGAENWSYASGSLLAGKQYFIKANIFPGVVIARAALGVADANDERIPKWRKWKAMAPGEADRAAFEIKGMPKAQAALQAFKDGTVKSYAEIKPEHAL